MNPNLPASRREAMESHDLQSWEEVNASVSVVYDVAELMDGMDPDERTLGSVLGLVHSMAAEDLNECAHKYELATLAGEELQD